MGAYEHVSRSWYSWVLGVRRARVVGGVPTQRARVASIASSPIRKRSFVSVPYLMECLGSSARCGDLGGWCHQRSRCSQFLRPPKPTSGAFVWDL